jgi:hypothetical protein
MIQVKVMEFIVIINCVSITVVKEPKEKSHAQISR